MSEHIPAKVYLEPVDITTYQEADPDRPFKKRRIIEYSPFEAEVAELRKQLQEALTTNARYDELKRGYDLLWRKVYARAEKPVDLGPLPKETRIGDRVRNKYIDHLSAMLSDGVLTQEEFSERMDKAATAKWERELKELVADLPDMPVQAGLGISKEFTQPAKRRLSPAVKTIGVVWAIAVLAWLFVLLLATVF